MSKSVYVSGVMLDLASIRARRIDVTQDIYVGHHGGSPSSFHDGLCRHIVEIEVWRGE